MKIIEKVYGIKWLRHLITKPIMKKKIMSLTVVLLSAGMVMAQQQGKKLPAPPPPPPVPGVNFNAPPPPPVVVQADMAEPPAPPPAPPTPPAKVDKLSSGAYEAFLHRNPQVEGLGWSDEGKTLRVQLKDGSEETYNLDNKEQAAKARLRYGKLPTPPPPPPAPVLPGND
jgi:hypothetical protein